jgi:para-nitrobenzyl esterase
MRKASTFTSVFSAGIVATLLLASGCGAPEGIADLEDDRPIVATGFGPVQGFAPDDGVWSWKGIPFAAPPVGELRWRAPRDPEPWQEPLEATESAGPCTQWEGRGARAGQTRQVIGSEDCLYLDVYRPRTAELGLPVYFWIHGGANNSGGAQVYDGSRIATRIGAIVVVTQYRLGPFGWFRHPALREGVDPAEDSGNFGTLDHLKALEWVRDNIEAFGGDRWNVTIAGESAGAHNVTNLLIAPAAALLFQRAISQSGGMTLNHGLDSTPNPRGDERSAKTVEALLNGAEPPEELAAFLRSQSAEDILRARTEGDGGGPMTDHAAYIDGTVIPGGLQESIAAGRFHRVPVILGANESEMKFFLPLWGPGLAANGFDNDWGKVHDLFNPDFDPEHEWSFDEIFDTEIERSLYEISARYGSRNWRAKYMDEVARPLREQQPEVWAYLFSWGEREIGPPHFAFTLGAAHAMEIPFFFGSDRSLFGYSFTEANEGGRKALQTAMMVYLGRFIHTGDPNTEVELPGWPDGVGEIPEWQWWSNEDGGAKAVVFDGDRERALIEMSTEEDSTAAVAADLEAELATWSDQQRDTHGWIPRSFLW